METDDQQEFVKVKNSRPLDLLNPSQLAVSKLPRFKVKRNKGMAQLKSSLNTIENEEDTFLSTSKSHLETVRKQNNIEDTVEHQDMIGEVREQRGP